MLPLLFSMDEVADAAKILFAVGACVDSDLADVNLDAVGSSPIDNRFASNGKRRFGLLNFLLLS